MIHKQTNLTLYLIRHAESGMNKKPELIAGRSPKTPLSIIGKEQAVKLGKYFKRSGISFDSIFSSPLTRSKQTAEITLKEIGITENKIIPVEDLVEFTQGDWEGRSRKEVYTPEVLKYMNAKGYLFKPPNGESQVMVEHRVSGWFINEIMQNPKYLDKESTIAIFSHGLAIKCFLHFVMGFNDRLIYRIRLDNTAICKLRFTSEGWFIDSINDVSHLG